MTVTTGGRDGAERAEERPHAPRQTRLRRWLGPLYFTGVFWYRVPLWVGRYLPDPLLRAFVSCCSVLAVPVLGGVRRALTSNVELVLGPCGFVEGWRRARRTMKSFAWCVIERGEQFVPGRAFDVEYEGLDSWHALVDEGTGFVLVTAHIGGWELGSTLPASEQDLAVHVVREPEGSEEAQRLTEDLLAGLGGARYTTHFATDDMALGVELLAALREGEIVALQADRPRSGGRTTTVPLFGASLEVPVGPAALARLAGVPIVPIFTLREGRRRYRVLLRPPIRVERGQDRDADHRAALVDVAREIEAAICRDPYQWFCFREVALSAPSEPARAGS